MQRGQAIQGACSRLPLRNPWLGPKVSESHEFHDLGSMFEGMPLVRMTLPAGWWVAWVIWAWALAALMWSDAEARSKWRWAWTDFRLLVQSLGEGHVPGARDLVVHGLAGVALSLSLAGMQAAAEGHSPTGSGVFRWLLLWLLLHAVRWTASKGFDWLRGSSLPGWEWDLNHRAVMESAALLLAPIGFVAVSLGPEASRWGLWLAGGIWFMGWWVRQRRSLFGLEAFRGQGVLAIVYLCALEILPTAVLIRAWQG